MRQETAEVMASSKDAQFDALRTLAIIGVLIIHSANRYSITMVETTVGTWLTLFSRPAIGVFLFLSGALFTIKPVTIDTLKRRLNRVICPYLFFSVFALLFEYGQGLSGLILHNPLRIVQRIITGETFGIYYFVFVIICMYILGFFVQKYIRTSEHLKWVMVGAFVIAALHHVLAPYCLRQFNLSDSEYINYADRSPFVWSCFFLFGMYYARIQMKELIFRSQRTIRLLWVVAFVVYNVLYFMQVPLSVLHGYHSIIGEIYTLTTIGVLLTYELRFPFSRNISQLSYYLYLSHIFFVYSLVQVAARIHLSPSIWMGLFSFVLSFVGPLILYRLIKRVLPLSTKLVLGA